MYISINVNCADIAEAMEALKKLGAKVTDVAVPTPAAEPVKRGRPAKAPKTAAAPVAASEEVDPVTEVAEVETAEEAPVHVRDIPAEYKAALAEARALIAGKGATDKEKALVRNIKSQCFALTGSEDTNAVVSEDDMVQLIAVIAEEIKKYKSA